MADVLDRLFGPVPDTSVATTVLVPTSPQEAAYAEGLAIACMASEQAQLASQKAEAVDARLTTFEAAVEARLMLREQISEEQAVRISDLVKRAAIGLSKKAGGGNYFETVFGQLYRMFGFTPYKLMTQCQYPKAVA